MGRRLVWRFWGRRGKNVSWKCVWVFILVRCYPALFGRSTVCVMKLCYVYLKYFTLRCALLKHTQNLYLCIMSNICYCWLCQKFMSVCIASSVLLITHFWVGLYLSRCARRPTGMRSLCKFCASFYSSWYWLNRNSARIYVTVCCVALLSVCIC